MSDIKKYKSKWQKKENETFRIRFLLKEINDKRVKLALEENHNDTTKEHWVEFHMWDYETMVSLRKRATKYHQEGGSFYIDHDYYNDLKVSSLLKDWSFGELDPHMKLQHVNGALTDESIVLFRSLYPWVVSSIIQKMNEVLEGYAS